MKRTSLSLAVPKSTSNVSSTITSPANTASDPSSPESTTANAQPATSIFDLRRDENDASSKVADYSPEDQPTSPGITSLPPFPSSPKDTPAHSRERSKGLFSNMKASKSSNKVYQVESTIRQVSEETPRSNNGQENPLYSMRKSPGSTPDLSLSNFETSSTENNSGRQTSIVR